MNPGHQPQRFQVYQLLENKNGFTIQGSQHIFLFDRYGGWCDEYGNCYDEHGQPVDSPSSSDSYSQSEKSFSSSDSDGFEKQFGVPRQLSDDDEYEMKEQQVQRFNRNLDNLQNYPEPTPLRVSFRNLPLDLDKEEVIKAYSAEIDGIINVILDKDENGENIGTGYFIANSLVARQIIKLEGKKLLQRHLYFEIQEYENYIAIPVTQKELENKPPEKTKKFVQKNPPKPEEVFKLEFKWNWYKFQKDIFPKKSQFRNWMIENGFNPEQDFKNIQKIENDLEKKYVKIEMKENTFNSINGHQFGQKKVEFIPL